VVGTVVNVPAGGTAVAVATCPSGKKAIGGGGYASSANVFLNTSTPASNAQQTVSWWIVGARNTGASASPLVPHAVCATVAP
jgi:hypothetical protein